MSRSGADDTALDTLQSTQPPGVLITTSALPKFYSNGLDLSHASSTPTFWTDALYPLWRKLLSFPMPTVALLNGHAFAAGLMLAMFHDYRIMNPQKGFVCLNEVDFGALLKAPMSSIFREKVPAATYRGLVLEGKRFTGPEALEGGIVDGLGGLEAALELVQKKKILEKGQSGVYGMLKVEMYRETWSYLTDEGFAVEDKKEKELLLRDDEEKERMSRKKVARL
ncbi:hypothetical protein jhhlp_008074 [Lomentospora prolificans]|uniref:Enoyl-CoA hydratase n=1 Tax=Lomentospora prolificans TaxID=41688 RepID=A0A2N3MZF0_9PEZI|nr:hypothetical protein jhhlp_008074 [Lomentospora prolificans]